MSLGGDKRERIHALTLAKECYAMKLDLLSSATVIDRAVRFVDHHGNKDLILDKEATSHDDLFDSFRLSLTFWY